MLKKFEVENYRRFKDTLSFDLTAASYEFNNECIKDGLVKTALVYGENASGKSCLGWAIFDIVEHLTDNDKDGLPRRNFLNLNSDKEAATFSYTFSFNNKDVIYTYKKDESKKLTYERLFINGDIIIEYHVGSPINTKLKGTESLNKQIKSDSNLSAIKYIYSNSNLHSNSPNNKIFKAFFEYVSNMLFYRVLIDDLTYIGFTNGETNIYQDILRNNNLKDFESFLKESGINCELAEIENNGEMTIGFKFGRKTIPISSIASTGTKSLSLFYFWWQQLKENKVSLLFIDEFDASYHFKLSRAIVKRLKQINSQVILTTHNTALLDNDLIRPDCGFIIDGTYIRSLHTSTSKELRYAHNIEKMYRAGGFNE